MIEVDDVIVQGVSDQDQVADVLRVERDLEPDRVLHRAHRGDGVDGGADAADALGEQPGLARVAPLQDELDAAPHLARGPGVAHGATFHLDVDAEMAFDAGDGIDHDTLRHDGSPYERAGAAEAGRAPPRIGSFLTRAM